MVISPSRYTSLRTAEDFFSQGDMGLMGLQTILVALHQLGQLLLDSEVTKGVFFCPINEGS